MASASNYQGISYVKEAGYLAPVGNDAYRWKQFRFNPLRHLTPRVLTTYIEQFSQGWIRNFCILLEWIEESDDMLAVDISKRKGAVASRASTFQIVIDDAIDQKDAGLVKQAELHKKALQFFYRNLSVSDATDLDVKGGISLLVRGMMDALIKRKANHEIIWNPTADGLTAEFKFVPQYFFEETRGVQRYTGPIGGLGRTITPEDPQVDQAPGSKPKSREIDPNGWFIAKANGWVGKAIAICQLYKALALRDLMNYSQRFGVPWVHGKTPAAYGTQEYNNFVDTVKAAANDAVIITTEMPGVVGESKIDLITPSGTGENVPLTILKEMNQRMTSILRGADLMTTSRKNAVGASLQGSESDLMEESDCEWASEQLQLKVDSLVIEANFGKGIKPLAKIVISPRAQRDVALDLQVDTFLLQAGVPQTVHTLSERYDRELPDDVDPDELAHAPTPTGQSAEQTAELAAQYAPEPTPAGNEATPNALAKLVDGINSDLGPIREAVGKVLSAPDAEVNNRILEFRLKHPELANRLYASHNGITSALAEEAARAIGEEFDNE